MVCTGSGNIHKHMYKQHMHNLETLLSLILEDFAHGIPCKIQINKKNAVLPTCNRVISAMPYRGRGIAIPNHCNKKLASQCDIDNKRPAPSHKALQF
jgi:hypothetical protein